MHRRALGDRPFVVVEPGRRHENGLAALAEAARGTLCVLRDEQPDDFEQVVEATRGPVSRVLLMVCAPAPLDAHDVAWQVATSIRSVDIPPLLGRRNELRRVIDEYARDAIADYGGGSLTREDREWIETRASGTHSQIGMAARRLVALHRCDGNVTRAAKLLSVSRSWLSDWRRRRAFPGESAVAKMEEGDGEA